MKKLLFIDRDGTLVVEPPIDYQLDSLEKLEFYPGVFQWLSKIAKELDYELVMVTNQDGLGTASYPEETFWPVQNKIVQAFKNEGIEFKEILIDKSFPEDNAPTRKPGTGLLNQYIYGDYDLANSYVIGDRTSDIELASNLKARGIFIGKNNDDAILCTTRWEDIYNYLVTIPRKATVVRKTRETEIAITVNLDGSGRSKLETGIGFFDHMLDQIARHGNLDLEVSAKGDLADANGLTYHYWSDGSIRDAPEGSVVNATALYRDYSYETDLRMREQEEFGLGDYNQNALVIPVGIGGLFRISNRAFFSVGISYYYAVSDMVDNVAYEGTSIKGSKGNDSFIYSNLGLHFDLFSDPTTRTVDLLYADVEFDPLLYDDEDGDFVLDLTDRCPGTPYGVEVDSLGCPLDGDRDGVPDYIDQELDTKRDAWVDEMGVTVSEEEFQLAIELRENAMPREEVDEYAEIISGQYKLNSQVQIPENFQSLDTDGDGYLSFEELLLVIDKYFDFQLDLDVEEVRQLNEFFFSQ